MAAPESLGCSTIATLWRLGPCATLGASREARPSRFGRRTNRLYVDARLGGIDYGSITRSCSAFRCRLRGLSSRCGGEGFGTAETTSAEGSPTCSAPGGRAAARRASRHMGTAASPVVTQPLYLALACHLRVAGEHPWGFGRVNGCGYALVRRRPVVPWRPQDLEPASRRKFPEFPPHDLWSRSDQRWCPRTPQAPRRYRRDLFCHRHVQRPSARTLQGSYDYRARGVASALGITNRTSGQLSLVPRILPGCAATGRLVRRGVLTALPALAATASAAVAPAREERHRAVRQNGLRPVLSSGAVTTNIFEPGADLISPAAYMVMRSLPSLSATQT